jgi:hypothetical protein
VEILVIVIVAAAAVAAVFYPLLSRRGSAPSGDIDPLERASPIAAPAAARPVPASALADDELEAEVHRYRDALRAGTVCEYCRQANPPASRFCYECGQRLETPAPRAATPET